MRQAIRASLAALALLLLPSCRDSDRSPPPSSGEHPIEGTFSFSPALVPVTISISTSGNVTVSLDTSFSIPMIGRFTFSAGIPLWAQQTAPEELLLVVRTPDGYQVYHARKGDKHRVVVHIQCPSTVTVDADRNRVDVDVSSCPVDPPAPVAMPAPPDPPTFAPDPPAFAPDPPAEPERRPSQESLARVTPRPGREWTTANMRSEPSQNSDRIVAIPVGEEVTLLGEMRLDLENPNTAFPRWYRARFNGLEGWLHESTIERE